MTVLQPTARLGERCIRVKNHLQTLHSAVCKKSHDDFTITKEDIGGQLDRFLMWAGNMGALRNPDSKMSLDSRLNDAPEVREHILRQLSYIDEAVESLKAILSHDRPNRQILVTAPTSSLDGEDVDRSDDELPSPDVSVDTGDEVQMKLGIISSSITMLFKIAIIVRKSVKQDQFFKALQKAHAQEPKEIFPSTYDTDYVRHKHPKLLENGLDSVAKRLGSAIAKRRQFIKFRREHVGRLGVNDHQKTDLEQPRSREPVKQQPDSQKASTKAPAEVTSSKATTFLNQMHPFPLPAMSEFPAIGADDDEDLGDAKSMKTATTAATTAQAVLKLPRLLSMAEKNEEFLCPFCFGAHAFSGDKAWRAHALSDLKPYLCTIGGEECDDLMFGDVDSWFSHELKHHRSHYVCVLCKKGPMAVVGELNSHLLRAHDFLDPKQFADFEEPGRREPESFKPEECPFCDIWADNLLAKPKQLGSDGTDDLTVPPNRFKKHLAMHQEQLAIFATPREAVNDGKQSMSSGTGLPDLGRVRVLEYLKVPEQNEGTADTTSAEISHDVFQDRQEGQLTGPETNPHHREGTEYIVDERYPMHLVDFSDRSDQDLDTFYSILESTRGYSTIFAYHVNKRRGFLMSSAADPEVPVVISSLSAFNPEPWKDGVRPMFPMFSMESIQMLLSEACSHNDRGYFTWAWNHHRLLYPDRQLDDIVWKQEPLLLTAVNANNPDMVQLCIELGGDPNVRRSDETPLSLAEEMRMPVISELVPFDAGTNFAGDETALHLAAEAGLLDIVKMLVVAGADVNAETREGKTALWIAASNGHLEIVEFLISSDADPEAPDAGGTTPWEAAARSGHDEVVVRLSSIEEDQPNIVDRMPSDSSPE